MSRKNKISTGKKVGVGIGAATLGVIGLGMIGASDDVQEFEQVAIPETELVEEIDNEEDVVETEQVTENSGIIQVDGGDSVIDTVVENEVQVSEESVVQQEVVEVAPEPTPATTQTQQETESDSSEEETEVEQVTLCDGIDINRASYEELKEIIHIDSDRAGEIIRLRPFASVESMTRINGIGPARRDAIIEQGLACV